MKNSLKHCCAPLLLVLFMLSPASVADEGYEDESINKVIVASDPWCPYVCVPDSEREGYMIDIGRAVFGLAGFEMHYQQMPWKRALEETTHGVVDAAVGATPFSARKLYYTDEIVGVDETVFVTLKGTRFCYEGLSSLEGKRIGVIANYSYDSGGPLDEYLAQKGDVIKIFNADSLERLFSLLERGRIDMFVESRLVSREKSYELGVQNDVSFIGTGVKNYLYYAFQPTTRGREMVDMFDKGMRTIRASGALKSILDRYRVSDWLENDGDMLAGCAVSQGN